MRTSPHSACSLVGETYTYTYGKVILEDTKSLSEIRVCQEKHGVLGEPFPKEEILELS